MKIPKLNYVGFIGAGGFGEVHKYKDNDGLLYAEKRFKIDTSMIGIEAQAKKRFIKEAITQHALDHPNIVKIIYLDTDSDTPRYIMPYADASLSDDIKEGIVNKDNFFKCFYDIMAGLEEIHSIGIYHRDLKPDNILRFDRRYAIGDFGLMSIQQTNVSTLTTTGMAKGSDMYTAPEITQDLKAASPQSDIYSLACILHDFVGVKNRIPCAEITEESEYSNILTCSTRRDINRRFKNVASFREALLSIREEQDEDEVDIITPKSRETDKILSLINCDIAKFGENEVRHLYDYLSSNINYEEKKTVLHGLSIEHINKIIEIKVNNNQIAIEYCDYVKNNSFIWEFCDTLTNRLILFIESGSIDVKSEGILALLYMGTKHNRWYVERKAYEYLSNLNMDSKLLKRLQIEIKIDRDRFVNAINHLYTSINVSYKNIHPEILHIIKQ